MANQFYIEPAQFGQGLQSLAGSVQQFGQQQRAQEKAAEQEAYAQRAKQAMSDAFQSGDPRKIMQVGIQFPEVSETMQQLYGFTNEQTEQAAKEGYRRFLGTQDPAERLAILEGTVDTISQLGGRPVLTQQDVERYKRDPEGTAKSIEMAYAGIDPKGYEALSGGSKGPSIGTYNPRDYTTESFAEFTRTGDPGVLERYAAQRTVDIGGVPHVFDPARGGYYPASVSGRGAGGEPRQRPITATEVAESEAEITGAREGAKQEVKAQSPEETRKRQAAVQETRQEISSAQDTISQIDNLLSSDEYIDSLTGVKGRLPAIPGTPGFDAEVAFDQFRNSLTLENLGKMSGVLSETDIKILSSAASGLEPGMSRDALVSRMETIRSVLENKSADARNRLQEMIEEEGGEQEDTEDTTVNWSDL